MILSKHLTIVNKSVMKVDILAIGSHPVMDKKIKLLLEKGEALPIMESFYTILLIL